MPYPEENNIGKGHSASVGKSTGRSPRDTIEWVSQNFETAKNLELRIQVDAEYWSEPTLVSVGGQARPGRTPNKYITVGIGDRTQKLVLEHPDWQQEGYQNYIKRWSRDDVSVFPHLLGLDEDFWTRDKMPRPFLKVELSIFHSFSDIVSIIGRVPATYLQTFLTQKNCISHKDPTMEWIPIPLYLRRGQVIRQVKVKVRDFAGVFNRPLKETAEVLAIPMTDKGLFDNHKSRMNLAYNDPDLRADFIKYQLGDLVLFDIEERYNQLLGEIRQFLGVAHRKAGRTMGNNMALLLQDKIDASLSIDMKLIEKWGLPHDEKVKAIETLIRENSIERILEADPQTTEGYGALVHGGRVRNEMPTTNRLWGPVASFDQDGAYGASLRDMSYPVGLPTVLRYDLERPGTWPSLGEFLKEWEDELVADCWMAVIETAEQLSFQQDVIYSKLVKKLPRKVEDEEEMGRINAEFVLLYREIKNGILTHYSLEHLRALATDKEWGELKRKIRIKTARIFQRSEMYEIDQIEEWKAKLEEEAGERSYTAGRRKRYQTSTDGRSGAWLRFPLRELVEPLIEKRAEYKKAGMDERQKAYKLIINCIYGTICSRFFKIGHPLVANQITDASRMACHGMALASGGAVSVTDGVEAGLNTFRMWKGNRPGLDNIARIGRGKLERRSKDRIQTIPLGDAGEYELRDGVLYRGKTEIEIGEVQQLYQEHLQQFFKDLKLTWLERYSYSIKTQYDGAVAHSQVDYGGMKKGGEFFSKSRGQRPGRESYNQLTGELLDHHPHLRMMRELYEGGKATPPTPFYQTQMLKIKQANKMLSFIKDNEAQTQWKLAGDSINKNSWPRVISPSQFHYPTAELRRQWYDHHRKLIDKTGWGLDYYGWRDGKINQELGCKYIQGQIDEGKGPNIRSYEKLPKHPYMESLTKGVENAEDIPLEIGENDGDEWETDYLEIGEVE